MHTRSLEKEGGFLFVLKKGVSKYRLGNRKCATGANGGIVFRKVDKAIDNAIDNTF